MAGDEEVSVDMKLNPEAAEFIPNRIQSTTLIKLIPSRTSSTSTIIRAPPTPPPHVLSFQNPNNYFQQYDHRRHLYFYYYYAGTPPYLHHTYTSPTITTTPHHPHPDHPFLYKNTNPNSNHPTQPLHEKHDYCLVGPGPGYRRRGKQRGYYRKKKSIRRRVNNGDHGMRPGFDQEGHDSSTSQPKFNFNAQKKYHYSRNNIALLNNKQRHYPVVPVKEDGGNTTVMIRNIPNRLTRDMLMDFLDDHCKFENQKAKQLIQIQNGDAEAEPIIVSAFDFLYLPMDFKSGVNKGYAFVNFTDPKAAWKFYLSAHNLSWVAFHSDKILQIASARLQGKEELERHFERTNFACDGKHEYLPVCFSPERDGSRETVNQRIIGRCTAKPVPNMASFY
ncbi:hypothetical protein Dsin_026707 [Dipteronia sinensis]|uniref:RRM domain-containing protein n=1 Tax=Dipteronia sinensis TaxID=43782 RepID=A0AAD9ZY63_9ROSI|nr:hypothetical protein Dsin_026707 [Dipteronia sinensis]